MMNYAKAIKIIQELMDEYAKTGVPHDDQTAFALLGFASRKEKPSGMSFTYEEAKGLIECFGGDEETEVSVIEVKEGDSSHSGPGLYAYSTEYPDEGTTLLGKGR